MKNDGGPAFPRPHSPIGHAAQKGMSLRQYYVGQALAGLCSMEQLIGYKPRIVAELAVERADAAIKAEAADAIESQHDAG